MKYFLWIIGIVTIMSPMMVYFNSFNGNISSRSDEWANFGSYVSGIYSFIATALIIWTFKNQADDSKIRHEQETFFKLLDLFSQTVSGISFKQEAGEKGLRLLYIDWIKRVSPYAQSRNANLLTVEDLKKEYSSFYFKNRNIVGHYFRLLYQIVKYIDQSSLDEKEKRQYMGFLRSRLSQVQLQFLFFNCLVGGGIEKFKPLVEKYSLLNNLEIDSSQPTIIYFKKNYNVRAFDPR